MILQSERVGKPYTLQDGQRNVILKKGNCLDSDHANINKNKYILR